MLFSVRRDPLSDRGLCAGVWPLARWVHCCGVGRHSRRFLQWRSLPRFTCCWPSFQSVRSVILCKRNATACTRVIRATNHAIWDATKRYSCFDARSSMPLPASALSTPRHRKGVGEWPARKRCTQAHACILHANAAARRSSAPHPGRGCDKQLDPRMPWHATALASPLTAPAPHGLGNGRRDEGHACICSKGRGEIFEGPRWATHAARRSIQRPCRSPPPGAHRHPAWCMEAPNDCSTKCGMKRTLFPWYVLRVPRQRVPTTSFFFRMQLVQTLTPHVARRHAHTSVWCSA